MDSSIVKEEAGEEVYVIDEKIEKVEVKVGLAKVRPLRLKEEEPLDTYQDSTAEPKPSTSRATVAEVRHFAPPPAPDFKWDPFDLAPRARFSPPPPPADRAKRRSVPGGHESAKPRLKFSPFQARR